jgi:hypothetical protein
MTLDLYKSDYDTWLTEQIRALEQGKLEVLDIPHLIEELEGLNKSNKREMRSYLIVLLAHLLKWQYQPNRRSGSWKASIANSRKGIEQVIKDQSSLKNYWSEILEQAYTDAKEWAADETKINIKLFPSECPYTVEQLRDKKWLPQ